MAADGYPAGRIYLPSSFAGGWRYQRVLTYDALAVVARLGKPSFFITMTCNPRWEEITAALEERQSAFDRPDIVARVFKAKLDSLLTDLRRGTPFQTPGSQPTGQAYLMSVVEFQKRGLPHVHIAVRMQG